MAGAMQVLEKVDMAKKTMPWALVWGFSFFVPTGDSRLNSYTLEYEKISVAILPVDRKINRPPNLGSLDFSGGSV